MNQLGKKVGQEVPAPVVSAVETKRREEARMLSEINNKAKAQAKYLGWAEERIRGWTMWVKEGKAHNVARKAGDPGGDKDDYTFGDGFEEDMDYGDYLAVQRWAQAFVVINEDCSMLYEVLLQKYYYRKPIVKLEVKVPFSKKPRALMDLGPSICERAMAVPELFRVFVATQMREEDESRACKS